MRALSVYHKYMLVGIRRPKYYYLVRGMKTKNQLPSLFILPFVCASKSRHVASIIGDAEHATDPQLLLTLATTTTRNATVASSSHPPVQHLQQICCCLCWSTTAEFVLVCRTFLFHGAAGLVSPDLTLGGRDVPPLFTPRFSGEVLLLFFVLFHRQLAFQAFKGAKKIPYTQKKRPD